MTQKSLAAQIFSEYFAPYHWERNEHIKEIIAVKGKPDIIHIIENKRLQW
jgi:hypothetical protein